MRYNLETVQIKQKTVLSYQVHQTSPKGVPVTGQLQADRQGGKSRLLVPGDTRDISLIHLLTGRAGRVSRSTSLLLLQTGGYSLEHRAEIHSINSHPSKHKENTKNRSHNIYTLLILYTHSILGKMKARRTSRLERVSFFKSYCKILVLI